MVVDSAIGYVANTAFSLTLSGNSGISPFLTMFLIGMAGKIQPEYLSLEPTMEKIMTSWPSLCLWSVMTILELIGKCVPVLDQVMDSIEAFIVPVMASLGTFSAFGSFDSDAIDMDNGGGDNDERKLRDNEYNTENRNKLRGLSTSSTSSVISGVSTFLRVILLFMGIILALSIHFFKMLMRLLGEGCLTQCITVLETTTVCISVLVSIFIRQFAIFVAACFLFAAGYNGKKRWDKWQKKKEQEETAAQQQQPQQQQQERSVEMNNATATNPPVISEEYARMEDTEEGASGKEQASDSG